jgi:hypothetical protein
MRALANGRRDDALKAGIKRCKSGLRAIKIDLKCSASGLHAAFFALADFAQVIPGIDSAGVTVIPGDIQCVSAHRLHFLGLGRLLIHWQQRGALFSRFAKAAMVVGALFVACGAGACVAQPLKAKVRVMAVIPLDVHSRTRGDVDFDGFGIDHGHNSSIQAGFACRG